PQTLVTQVPLEWTSPRPADLRGFWGSAAGAEVPGERAGVLSVLVRCDGGAQPPPITLASRALDWRQGAGWHVAALQVPAGTHVLAVAAGHTRICRAVPVVPGEHTALVMSFPPGQPGESRVVSAVVESSLLVSRFPIAGNEEELLRQVVAQQSLG